MRNLANSKDSDEIPHYAEFHQSLHCLLKQNRSSEKEVQFYLKLTTYDPSIYTMDIPSLSNMYQTRRKIKG